MKIKVQASRYDAPTIMDLTGRSTYLETTKVAKYYEKASQAISTERLTSDENENKKLNNLELQKKL